MTTKHPNRRIKSPDLHCAVCSLDELDNTILKIGELQTRLEYITAKANQEVQDIKARLKKQAKAIDDEIKVLHKASQVYFTANQRDIVPAGKKSAHLKSGEIGTRTPPLSVTIKNAEQVIEALDQLDINELITVKRAVNKPGLIKYRKQVTDIPGITFHQVEQFFINPEHIQTDHLTEVNVAQPEGTYHE